ncbi:MAG: hypothetical protein EBS31_09060 [Burkholderiaceae bacterium]|nr:hypothetical protein [Burkholderiaceae bacterium]
MFNALALKEMDRIMRALLLVCGLIMAHSSWADERLTHQIISCHQGKNSDCSDCSITEKPHYQGFMVNPREKTVVIHTFGPEKNWISSSVFEDCKIQNKDNWTCDLAEGNAKRRYQAQNSFLEYLINDPEQKGPLRYCGFKSAAR